MRAVWGCGGVCEFTAAALQRLSWRENRVLLCADCRHLETNTFFVGALLGVGAR